MKQGGDVSRETAGEMFHVKRSREGEDVSRETKEGGVPVFGGGLPSLPPADHAFSLFSFPHPPDPLPLRGRGRFLFYFAGGWRPRHPLRLSLRSTGLPGGSAPCIPGAKPGRHWLFSAASVLFAPIPPTPFPAGRGRPRLFCARGSAPCIPGAEPARRWLGRGWRPRHPCG